MGLLQLKTWGRFNKIIARGVWIWNDLLTVGANVESLYPVWYELLLHTQSAQISKFICLKFSFLTPGLSNLNQPRAAHLSVRSWGGPHEAKLGEFYRFSKEFWL